MLNPLSRFAVMVTAALLAGGVMTTDLQAKIHRGGGCSCPSGGHQSPGNPALNSVSFGLYTNNFSLGLPYAYTPTAGLGYQMYSTYPYLPSAGGVYQSYPAYASYMPSSNFAAVNPGLYGLSSQYLSNPATLASLPPAYPYSYPSGGHIPPYTGPYNSPSFYSYPPGYSSTYNPLTSYATPLGYAPMSALPPTSAFSSFGGFGVPSSPVPIVPTAGAPAYFP